MSEYPDQRNSLWARYRSATMPAVGPWTQVIQGLLAHRSVRAYAPTPLPEGTVESLVAAAQSAASSSNLQLWDVVAVTDPARKARLSLLAGDQAHIREAPLFLVWVANFSRAVAMAEAQGKRVEAVDYLELLMTGCVDVALAAQNATVAAESLGLGAVYIGGIRNHIDQVAEELVLPSRAFAVVGMAVGYPDPARPAVVKPRLPQSVVLHRETFAANLDLAEIEAYDARALEFQREQAMPEIGWTRTVLSRLRNADSLHGRANARELLQARGIALR